MIVIIAKYIRSVLFLSIILLQGKIAAGFDNIIFFKM